MSFDHDIVLAAAVERLRCKGIYSDLLARFLPDEFTLADEHEVFETALGEKFNIYAFRPKVLERDFSEDTGDKCSSTGANCTSFTLLPKTGLCVLCSPDLIQKLQ